MKEIPLTRGYVALVDDEDFERFGHLRWSAIGEEPYIYARHYYWPTPGKRKDIFLRREIMNRQKGRIRTRNGNTLDCRKANLFVSGDE
jgi:hypothetical protein